MEQINTTSARGKLIFHVFGALAEFERDNHPRKDDGGTKGCQSQRKGRRSKVGVIKRSEWPGYSRLILITE